SARAARMQARISPPTIILKARIFVLMTLLPSLCGRFYTPRVRCLRNSHSDSATRELHVRGIWLQCNLVIHEGQVMSITITGVVKNGVVVPSAALPEGAQVEIRLGAPADVPATTPPTPRELRRMPREQRQAILAA